MVFSPFFLTFLGAKDLDLRLISTRKKVMGFSFFFILVGSLIALLPISVVLVFFNQQFVSFWATGINFPSLKG